MCLWSYSGSYKGTVLRGVVKRHFWNKACAQIYRQRVRRWRQGSGLQVAHQEHNTKANATVLQTINCAECANLHPLLLLPYPCSTEEKQYSEAEQLSTPHKVDWKYLITQVFFPILCRTIYPIVCKHKFPHFTLKATACIWPTHRSWVPPWITEKSESQKTYTSSKPYESVSI